MKKFLSTLVLSSAMLMAKANVLTVSNDNVNPGQYTSISAAMAAANAGDTLLIQGTPYNYGTITVTKGLVFIGAGHNPIDRQNTNPTTLDDIELQDGSANAKFYGLNLNNVNFRHSNADNTVFNNCRIRTNVIFYAHDCDQNTFDGCVFSRQNAENFNGNGYRVGGLKMQNSVLNGRFYNIGGGSDYNYINYCIFLNNANNSTFSYSNWFYVLNSLFIGAAPSSPYSWVVWTNNAAYYPANGATAFPANSNGVATTNWVGTNPQLTTYPSITSSGQVQFFDYAHNYRLAAGSPFISSSTDGTPLGVYGNPAKTNILTGYNHYGMPMNPYINSFQITGPTTINAGDNLQIYMKAKLRND